MSYVRLQLAVLFSHEAEENGVSVASTFMFNTFIRQQNATNRNKL